MRTLNLNKRPIWQVSYIGVSEILDDFGYPTGESEKLYSSPKLIHLNTYTTTSEIIEQMFGTTNKIDIVCSDSSVELNKHDKFFYDEPDENTNMELDYDLKLTAKSESLNHWQYGFEKVR